MSYSNEYERILDYIYDYFPSTDSDKLAAELLSAGVERTLIERAIKDVAAMPLGTTRGCFHALVIAGFMLAGLWSFFLFLLSNFSDGPVGIYWEWDQFTALIVLDFAVPLFILCGLWARWRVRTLLVISGIGWLLIGGAYAYLFVILFIWH